VERNGPVSVSRPTIRRLPTYFPIVEQARHEGQDWISSAQIATALGLESIQVRKDLAAIGVAGQPRLGYPVTQLMQAVERCLGWNNVTDAFVIGAGHLGSALAGYRGFERHGLNVVALFDNDPEKTGTKVHGKDILAMSKFPDLVRRMRVRIAILTVPDEVAEKVARRAVEAGIQAIWNFTAAQLAVPGEVIVERMDLAASLAVLSSRLVAQRARLERSDA